ncbi:MFS transporter [Cohnella sp. GCM10027633]|uniref:MFS transporter n=1 Tax=unclassified Cohnella TaxID=2636738 RepID=UPI00363BF439
MIAVLVGTFSLVLTNSAFNVLLPSLTELYGISASLGGWIISLYALAMTLTMPLAALVVDRLGRKRTYLLGLGLYGAFSAIGGLFAAHVSVILLMRVMHGIAAGLLIPLSLALLFDHYGDSKRGRIVGVWGMLLTIAPAIGPTLGGVMMQFGHLPLLLWANVPLSLLALLLCRSRIRAYEPVRRKTIRLAGIALLASGIASICFGIQLFAASGESRGFAVFLLLLGIALLAVFVKRENRMKEPLIRYRLLRRNSLFAASLAVSTIQDVAMFGVLFALPLLFHEVIGLSPSVAGAMFVPVAVCTSLFGWIGGRWVDDGRPLGYIAWGIALMAASSFAFFFVGPGASFIVVLTLMTLRGIGNGLSDMTMTTIGLNALPNEDTHEGASLSNTLQRLVSSFAVLLLALYYDIRTEALALAGMTSAASSRTALQEECVALGCLLAASLPLVYYISRKRGDTVVRDGTATTA